MHVWILMMVTNMAIGQRNIPIAEPIAAFRLESQCEAQARQQMELPGYRAYFCKEVPMP